MSDEHQEYSTQSRPGVLQVHFCSPGELNDFYATNPSAVAREFYDQIITFVSKGYASGYILTPELAEIGYDTGLILANSPHAQMQWHRQFSPEQIDADNWLEAILHTQIEHYKPEILLLTGDINLSPGFFHTSLFRPQCIVAWPYAVVSESLPWSDFNLVLSGLSRVLEKAGELGAHNTAKYYPGFRSDLFKQIEAITPVRDISFYGAWSSVRHHKRNFYLTQMGAVGLELQGQLKLGFFLDADTDDLPYEVKAFQHPACYGIEALRVVRSSSMVFDLDGLSCIASPGSSLVDLSGNENTNPRLFEVTGCGSLLLTEQNDNLSELFIPGKEVVTYSDPEDLHRKMAHYFQNPEELSEIAMAGMHRCHRDHNMTQRALQFDSLVATIVSSSKGSQVTPTTQLTKALSLEGPLGKAASGLNTLLQAIELLCAADADSALALASAALKDGEHLELRSIAALIQAHALRAQGKQTEALELLNALPAPLLSSAFIQSGIEEINSRSALAEPRSTPPEEKPAVLSIEAKSSPQITIAPIAVDEKTLAAIDKQINRALKALDKSEGQKALKCVSHAKSYHVPAQDLDYTRALCFLKLDRMREAILALREELIYFPDNRAAKDLLEQLSKIAPPVFSAEQKEDTEFVEYARELSPYSSLAQESLFSLYQLAREVCNGDIQGNFVECGTGQGGSALMLAAIAKRFSGVPRTIYTCDTYSGLPAPGKKDRYNGVSVEESGWGEGSFLAPSAFLLQTAKLFSLQDLLVPIEGSFDESLSERHPEFGSISLLHLDCCLYASTLTALDVLYNQVAAGGIVIIQGMSTWEGTGKALEKFTRQRKEKIDVDTSIANIAWFRKVE